MANEKKTSTPLLISVIAFVLGMALGAWGLIKEDCIGGPGCWVGSGFLKIAGIILIIGGVIGMFTIGSNRRK